MATKRSAMPDDDAARMRAAIERLKEEAHTEPSASIPLAPVNRMPKEEFERYLREEEAAQAELASMRAQAEDEDPTPRGLSLTDVLLKIGSSGR